ncbi:MAG: 7-cyano-7-deazaguanine synthase QueC [bacterium]
MERAPDRERAIILLSGGVDSTTCLAIAREEGRELYALSFRYGQRHLQELDRAARIAVRFGVKRHIVVDFDMRTIGGSALTAGGEIPKGRDPDAIAAGGIPSTYVPARNTVFLSFALAWAEVIGALEIFIGVNAIDFSGYPDCRPAFIEAFQRLVEVATRAGVEGRPVRIRAPLLHMTKAEIIAKGLSLGVDYAMTHSCYDPPADRPACGRCDSCLLRRKGFAAAGVSDPIDYGD